MLDYSPYLGRYVVIKPSKVSVQKYLEVTSMHHVHKTVQVIPIAMEMKNVALMVILIDLIIPTNPKKTFIHFLLRLMILLYYMLVKIYFFHRMWQLLHGSCEGSGSRDSWRRWFTRGSNWPERPSNKGKSWI